jgi:sulfate transport system permease protein
LWLRLLLITTAATVLGVLIVVPVVNVFYQALRNGVGAYGKSLFGNADTLHSIQMTLLVAPLAVLGNLTFGVAAAWAIARFRFPGRSLLLALIDLPFSVSPVVAGLVFVLLFGLQGLFGPYLRFHGLTITLVIGVAAACGLAFLAGRITWPGRPWRVRLLVLAVLGGLGGAALAYYHRLPYDPGVRIVFAWPGLVLATAFVTFPFVARELIPVMEATGAEEELAAISLGASGWQMFRRITLPNIKWGLLYGVILCNARAMGEFGAVYVVSGRVAGSTETMPLRVEKLFQEYQTTGSFALASLLTLLALITLAVKTYLERRHPQIRPAAHVDDKRSER